MFKVIYKDNENSKKLSKIINKLKKIRNPSDFSKKLIEM